MSDVISKLERVANWMDAEELEKEKERRRQEAERRRREDERLRKEAEIARVRLAKFEMDVHQKQREQGTHNVEQSALDKLMKLGGGQPQPKPPGDAYMNDLRTAFTRRDSSRGLQKEPSFRGSLQRDSSRRGLSSQSSLNDSNNRSGEFENGRRQSRRGSNGGSRTPRRGSNESERVTRRGSNDGDRPRRRASNEREEVRRRPERRGSNDGDQPLPPPLAPPAVEDGFPPPPSYNTVVDNKRRESSRPAANHFPPSVLEQAAAHAAAGGATTRRDPSVRESFPPSHASNAPVYANRELEQSRRAMRTKKMPFRDTKKQARDKYDDLKATKRIHVMPINTHQGRMGHSTNGCAVISPLVVSHHLRSRSAVTDHEIVDVIDRECGPLLREIRGKLGLGDHALIIPSDVHDHLVDKKVLNQDNFVGATGGNIMDRKHLAEFLRLLDSGEKNSHQNKRTGAALFYREHVVSIVKVPLSGGKWCYDLIDSLPGLSNGNTRMASRTRCRDLSAFESYIRYYASNKLSDSNCSYIDKNDWDDNMADFDPRVFQGFVWGDK